MSLSTPDRRRDPFQLNIYILSAARRMSIVAIYGLFFLYNNANKIPSPFWNATAFLSSSFSPAPFTHCWTNKLQKSMSFIVALTPIAVGHSKQIHVFLKSPP